MINRFTLLLIALFAIQQTKAQDVYWPANSSEINTGSNATYLVQSVNLGEESVPFGYNLGAFYTNDSGELACGGIVNWGGVQTNIAVNADDSTTPEKDGFSAGEQITWLAYGTFLEQTYGASVVLGIGPTGMGSEIFSINSINIITEYNIDPTVETLIQGCTNAEACNYDETAQEDDGSCEFPTEGYDCIGNCIDTDGDTICDIDETSGCTDLTACNYISAATDDDGSCNYALEGYHCDGTCIDTDEDTVCDFDELFGCTDSLYAEYNALATEEDNSCATLIISGCTDSTAFNFDALANTDNSTCLSEVTVIFEDNVTNTTINYNVSSETISLTLGDSEISDGDLLGGFVIVDGQLICVGFTTWTGEDLSLSLWLDDINTPEIDGLVEGETIYWIAQQNNTLFNYLLELTSVEVGTGDIFVTAINLSELTIIGCMDNTAYNFNESAFVNDGACIPFIYGCIELDACNYNPEANTEDGSCYYITATVSELTYGTPLSVETDADSPSYTWYLNGEVLTETTSEYTPFVNGEYTVEITDNLGCVVSDTVTINNVSIQEQVDKKLSIYPIPAISHITLDAGSETIISAKLFTLEGKLLQINNPNSNQFTFKRGQLDGGIYYIQVEFDDGLIQQQSVIFE
jgi:hypothetical protein